MSDYKIQVVHIQTGAVVEWAPGLKAEADLVAELSTRVRAKGVGVGRTSNHVILDVVNALQELLFDLKTLV